jgi:prevent-host-death family protein
VKTIPASQFKARCLALLDEVERRRETLVVTKHGKPVAAVVPVDKPAASAANPLKGSIVFESDIVRPLCERRDKTR